MEVAWLYTTAMLKLSSLLVTWVRAMYVMGVWPWGRA